MFFDWSPTAKDWQRRLTAFMDEQIYPNESNLYEQSRTGNRWQSPPLLEELKSRAKAAGLWNLFLCDDECGPGLTNLEYAPLCETMGRS
ncbi:MAG: acyl-CoA dehydrogenase, partial [Planctomycetaceae bacterium]